MRLYIPSLLLSIVLTLAALLTLPTAFGLTSFNLYTPWSTVGLLALTALNCTVRSRIIKGWRTT